MRRWPPRRRRARRRCPATARRASGTSRRASAPISSAPRSTAWVAIRSSSKSKSSWPPTTTTSARVANGVRLTIRSPASATWSTSACAPDHERRAAVAARELELQRRADRHDLVQRGLEAEPPQLAHEVLGCVTDVVGEEQHRRARLAQRRDRLHGALARLVADPQAAVEVEQHVVVRADARGDRHAACLSSRRPCSGLALILCLSCALLVAACGEDDDSPAAEATATATEAPARTGGLRGRGGAGAEGRGHAAEAEGGARRRQDLRGDRVHQLRRLRDHARRQAGAEDRRLVQVAGRQGLLRRARPSTGSWPAS